MTRAKVKCILSNVVPIISLSIVSHGQSYLVRHLLDDLAELPQQNFEVLITINIPEDESPYQGYPFPISIIRNVAAKGFGANHNFAFSRCLTPWFAVVNPDIRIESLDLQVLISPFQSHIVAAVAPVVLSTQGKVEDSARRFPTFTRFVKRIIFKRRNADYQVREHPYSVDWVAGMFVVFRRDAFQEIGGFDDRRFFMYLEDAEICKRIATKGWKVIVNPDAKIIHMAQRASRRNLRHMRWHAVSAFRYLTGL
jgi:N-acetylglucosaminyl-diphospho-decaprenol L-rhamnosyltransferase